VDFAENSFSRVFINNEDALSVKMAEQGT